MSICRHLLLLSCTPALVWSCASRPELVPAKAAAAHSDPFRIEPIAAPEPRALEPLVVKPYTPIRTRDAVYSWQSEKRTECTPQMPEPSLALEPSPVRAILAAFPERASSSESSVQPASPDLIVAALRPALHRCFSRWLDNRVDAQGSVRFQLELGCAGDVSAISAENRGIDESTLACLFSALAPARFAPPTGGRATIVVPVVLKNAAR